MAELADAQDLKSWVPRGACGFETRSRHHRNIVNADYNHDFAICFLKRRKAHRQATGRYVTVSGRVEGRRHGSRPQRIWQRLSTHGPRFYQLVHRVRHRQSHGSQGNGVHQAIGCRAVPKEAHVRCARRQDHPLEERHVRRSACAHHYRLLEQPSEESRRSEKHASATAGRGTRWVEDERCHDRIGRA